MPGQRTKPLFCKEAVQTRPGAERVFQFSRDRDGRPWLTVIENGEETANYSFNHNEFQDFCAAARDV